MYGCTLFKYQLKLAEKLCNRSFPGPYFPLLRMHSFLHFQYKKNTDQKNAEYDHVLGNECYISGIICSGIVHCT